MAGIFIDGFPVQFADDSKGFWDSAVNASPNVLRKIEYTATNKRTGDGCVRMVNNSTANILHLVKTLPANETTVYIGVGLYWDNTTVALEGRSNNAVPILILTDDGGNRVFSLAINDTTLLLEAYSEDHTDPTHKIGTASLPIQEDVNHYIDVLFTISSVSGACTVRLDGNVVITASGIDTQPDGATPTIRTVNLGFSDNGGIDVGTGDLYFDDFYIGDASGSVSNSYADGAGIEAINPNGDGNYEQWTSTEAPDTYTAVDDVTTYGNTSDDDTTKVSHDTSTERSSVTMEDTTIAGTVQCIQLSSYVKDSVSGVDALEHFVRLSATDYDQASWVPAVTYGWHHDLLTLNPNTSARWTTGEIDGMEMGWEIT